MDALHMIFTRRSIRKYTDEPITTDQETLLLKAAMCAPNTVNRRNWAFIVVRDPARLNALAEDLRPNAEPLRRAKMAIIPCGDLSLTLRGMEEYWVQDCSAATENLLLAAHAMGLGALWMGTYPQWNKVNNVARTLNLPRHIQPLCVIGLGYPAEEKPSAADQRYEPVKIHHEQWEEK